MKKKPTYIIIAGASRSGTTALFNYLSDHDEICPSSIKQTLYFLDEHYPHVEATKRYPFDPKFENYARYFSYRDEAYCLEATPDYMYDATFYERIERFRKHFEVVLIFVLRNPIERLQSYYHHAKAINAIEQSCTFSDFIFSTKTGKFALESGRYSTYLKELPSCLHLQSIFVYFEELAEDPRKVMGRLCDDLRLSNKVYDNYAFKVHNARQQLRSPRIASAYRRARQIALNMRGNSLVLDRFIDIATIFAKKVYALVNKKGNGQDAMDEKVNDSDIQKFVTDFYHLEVGAISTVVGKSPSWREN